MKSFNFKPESKKERNGIWSEIDKVSVSAEVYRKEIMLFSLRGFNGKRGFSTFPNENGGASIATKNAFAICYSWSSLM